MTKKAEKLLNSYNEKMELQKALYERGFNNFKELQANTLKEEKQFQDMLSGMLHFGILSNKDFTELYNCCDIRFNIIDSVIL